MKLRKVSWNEKGFSLAELLIVVAVVAVLAVIAVPVFASSLESGREAADIANMRSAKAAAEDMYFSGRDLDGNALSSAGFTCYFDASSGMLTGERPEGYGRGTAASGSCEDFCLISDPDDYYTKTYYTGSSDVSGCYISVYVNDSGVSSLCWTDEEGSVRAGARTEPREYTEAYERGLIYSYEQLVKAFHDGGNFSLAQDITIPSYGTTLTTNPDKSGGISLKINMRGHSIRSEKAIRLIRVTPSCRLDISDSSAAGRIEGSSGSFGDGGGTLILIEGTLYTDGITLCSGHNSSDEGGGAIYNTGKFIANRTLISGCSAKKGAAVLTNGSRAQNLWLDLSVRDCSSQSEGDICLKAMRLAEIDDGCFDCSFSFGRVPAIGAYGGRYRQDISANIDTGTGYIWSQNDTGDGYPYRIIRR